MNEAAAHVGRKLLAGSGGGGEAGLLTLLEKMNSQDVAIIWIIVGLLILINFLWELFTDGIEHLFWKKNRHIVVMLQILYKGKLYFLSFYKISN